MPAPVNGTSAASAIAALLRQVVAGQAQAKRRANVSVKAGKASKGSDGQRSAPLADLISMRAAALNPDASDYQPLLLRLVVEASLLHEFGSALINAPKFQAMVDQVLHEIQTAPQLKDDVQAVLKGFTKGQWP
jgi:hypothetical protein